MTKYTFDIFKEMLKVDHKQLTKNDEDCVVLLVGREGKGKSMLSLHAIEHWFDICRIEKTPENFNKTMGVKLNHWAWIMKYIGDKQLKASINAFDEAGDVLSGKHSTNKIVTAVEDSYKVIRGLNLMSIFTSPDLFTLSPYLRYHRVRVCWWVETRGLCHVFHGNTLKQLMSKNENKAYKDMRAVKPDFSFKFPDYKGVFLERYREMKGEKMQNVLGGLYDVVSKGK